MGSLGLLKLVTWCWSPNDLLTLNRPQALQHRSLHTVVSWRVTGQTPDVPLSFFDNINQWDCRPYIHPKLVLSTSTLALISLFAPAEEPVGILPWQRAPVQLAVLHRPTHRAGQASTLQGQSSPHLPDPLIHTAHCVPALQEAAQRPLQTGAAV